MSDKSITTPTLYDGFAEPDEGAGNSIIKGTKIKFANSGEWLDADDVIPPSREFLVIEIRRVVQKWRDQVPVDTRILEANEHFPDVERLNAEAPQEEWREAFGKKVGPWQNSVVVYLLDPKTMGAFTWPASTVGGFRAVSDLKAEIRRARMLQGATNLYPLVTLGGAHMATQFGGRQRPAFKIVKFVAIGGQAARPLIEESKPEQLNDKITF